MRIKNTKITFFNFLPFECSAAEEYLEIMAEKGWLLESITGNFFKFKKIEKAKIKYSVDVFQKVSIFDCKNSNVALEYREYCESAGWKYICEKGKIQIFYTEDDKEIIPIHTDENEKFKSVFKTSLYYIINQLFLILMFILNIYIQLFLGDGSFALGSNLGVFSIVAVFSFILITTIEIINFVIWSIKARGKIKENKFMPYNNYKQLRQKNRLKNFYSLTIILILLKILVFDNKGSNGSSVLFALIICIPIVIMSCIKIFINKKRYSKNTNMAITISMMIVSIYLILIVSGFLLFQSINKLEENKVLTEKVNLTFVDFGYKESDNTNPYIRIDKSIIAKRIDYSESNEDNYLSYTILESKYPWIVKFHENRLLNKPKKYDLDIKKESTNLSAEITVYSYRDKKSFILVSEDKVINISKDFSDISDDEFLNVVYKKLFN